VEHAWSISGACVEHVWSMRGACVEHVWSMRGACVEHVWSMCGACVEHVWSMHGACMEHAWSMCGACVEHMYTCAMGIYMYRCSLHNSVSHKLLTVWWTHWLCLAWTTTEQRLYIHVTQNTSIVTHTNFAYSTSCFASKCCTQVGPGQASASTMQHHKLSICHRLSIRQATYSDLTHM